MSALRLYNTLKKGEEEFTPIEEGKVRMYTCGPTVYGRPHIGNYSSFLMADLLRRWLQFGLGYSVVHVKNITDVGHLVADADTGEDKVEKEARRIAGEKRGEHAEVTMEDVIGVSEMYTRQYLEDEQALNLIEPEHRPRATQFIGEMRTMVEKLLLQKHAYVTDDGIYFDVHSKMPTPYGALSGNTLKNLESGARVAVDEKKRHPADFALWKFCTGVNEKHALRWDSPKGPKGETYPQGFPGWHIECSAMSSTLLGDQIDIHTGGEDNIFPHHECEIAQSESVTGRKPFVRLWLHKRRIQMGKEKMSKSLGNVKTLSDIVAMGYSPMDLRYYFLSVHYRTQLKFTEKGLEDARKDRKKIIEWIKEAGTKIAYAKSEQLNLPGEATPQANATMLFCDAMNDDLNTPAALAVVHKAMSAYRGFISRQQVVDAENLINLTRSTFGCFDPEEPDQIPAGVQALVTQRAAARAAKDFRASDLLRDQIRALGYEVRDEAAGQRVEKL